MSVPLSLLDLARIAPGETPAEGLAGSVTMAQAAERSGYTRVWYAEHHNVQQVGSSATSVFIGHVAANTSTIRVGSGGVMLPNHSPLVIAEQFGTLATLYPDRIDLGLGRAPGTDGDTVRALRRSASASQHFPEDVQELQGYLRGESVVPGVWAIPGHGTHVPLYILGSSLFGASLAGALGLPFAFGSHFSPDMLLEATATYRREFRPSAQLAEPYLIAVVNVVAADDEASAAVQHEGMQRTFARSLMNKSHTAPDFSEAQVDAFRASPSGQQIAQMIKLTAVGTRDDVRSYLEAFTEAAGADELMTIHQTPLLADRIRSIELTAEAMSATRLVP